MQLKTPEQRAAYDHITRMRDEVSYCYCQHQHAKLSDATRTARELTTARVHFDEALHAFADAIRNEPISST